MRYIAWLWRNSSGERLNMGIRILAGVLQVAMGLVTIWLSKIFIDETIRVGTDCDIVVMVCFLVSTVTAGVLLRQLVYYKSVTSCARGVNRLRGRIFESIFYRPLFQKGTLHSGDVASRVMKDAETICDVNFDKLPAMVVTTVQLTGSFLLMRWFDPRLAWTLLLLTPIAIFLGKLIARRLRKMTAEIRQSESRIQMHVQECTENDPLIRSMESEGFVGGLLKNMQNQLMGQVIVRGRFTVAVRLIIGLSFGLGYLLAFVWGGIGLRNHTITFGVLTSFLQLVGQIQHPIFNLLNTAPQLIHATASIDRIEEIADKVGCRFSKLAKVSEPADLPFGICLENLSFRYDERLIFDKLNLEVKPGQKIALMGGTGVGKTTFFRILLGLVKPQSGTAWIYNGETRIAANENTRDHFVFVPQGNTLISGSLRLNMQMARSNATDEEILHALHTASADFVKELPAGLDTELGERGYGLSEGQAQRIAIARGLLQKGSIMLLDEISAALDAEIEREMFRRIFAEFPQKTMIFITHRPAVCNLCDSVVQLDSLNV